MSQRTRARTTGAAAKPTNHAEPADGGMTDAMSDGQPQAAAPATSRHGKRAAAPAPPTAATQQAGLPLQPDALARALRAVATELERDPALAQRVAHAINEAPATPAPSVEPPAQATPANEPRTQAVRQPRASAKAQRSTLREPATEPAAEPATEPAPPTIGRSFHPTIVTGVAEALGPGVPDPFALRQKLGEEGLREAMATLRLGSLRAIIRQHGLDPSGNLSKLNDAEKLRAHILTSTRKGRN